jgi:CTD kinase subunit gamma
MDTQVVAQIEDVIKERETTTDDLELASSPNVDAGMVDAPALPSKSGRKGAPHRLDKRQVEQRIEEDRERHKRERENIWAINGEDAEMNRLWEDTSDWGEDDDRLIAEEETEFQKAMEMQKCHHKRGAANGVS